MKKKIKKCAFCGSKVEIIENSDGYYDFIHPKVPCFLDNFTPYFLTEHEFLELWNKRHAK